MEQNFLVNLLFFTFLAWFLYRRFSPVKGLEAVNEEELRDRMRNSDECLLIDVREPHEFCSGHIPGAINIPLSQLRQRLSEIPHDKEIILYCRSGMRSRQAAKILQKRGIGRLYHLAGGMMSWSGTIAK
ncbi:rhodanese-like domain-containing protein [Bacillaceae bacterium]